MGCHFLLQGIFPTQGSNPGLLNCRQILYRLSYKGSSNSSLGGHNSTHCRSWGHLCQTGLVDSWPCRWRLNGFSVHVLQPCPGACVSRADASGSSCPGWEKWPVWQPGSRLPGHTPESLSLSWVTKEEWGFPLLLSPHKSK